MKTKNRMKRMARKNSNKMKRVTKDVVSLYLKHEKQEKQ